MTSSAFFISVQEALLVSVAAYYFMLFSFCVFLVFAALVSEVNFPKTHGRMSYRCCHAWLNCVLVLLVSEPDFSSPHPKTALCSTYSPVISELPAIMSLIPAIWQCYSRKSWGVWICHMKALVTSVILVFEDQDASWDRWLPLLRNWGHK